MQSRSPQGSAWGSRGKKINDDAECWTAPLFCKPLKLYGSGNDGGLAKGRFQDVNIQTALLKRAIASASNDKGAAEHSELMNFLRAQNDAYNNQAHILIDSALADNLSSKLDQRDSKEVRVYDLDDLRAANIRGRIKPLLADAHFLFLTVRR